MFLEHIIKRKNDDHSMENPHSVSNVSQEWHEAFTQAQNQHSSDSCGVCGDLTWTCRNGVLYVQGEGMLDRSWRETLADGVKKHSASSLMHEHNITHVVIAQGCTEIGFGAFRECYKLVSIEIPAGVKRIAGKAFQGCTSLVEIKLPEGATIAPYAFQNCKGLERVELPEDLTEITECVFFGCEQLRTVNLPYGISKIGASAFCFCKSLCTVEFPISLLEIGTNAFNSCIALKSIELRNPNISLGLKAFANCTALSDVFIEGLRSIGEGAFENCTALTAVDLSDRLHEIGNNAFLCCSALESISIPATVINIGRTAFYGCSGLKSVTISQGVQSIGDRAFSGCTALETLVVPDSVKQLGDAAFYGVPHVIYRDTASSTERQKHMTENVWDSGIYYYLDDEGTLHIEGSGYMPNFDTCEFACYSPWAFGKWSKVIVHEGVQSLGDYAFWRSASLDEIVLPDSITYIGKHCFDGCKKLRSFQCPPRVSEIKSSTFKDCEALETVKLPQGMQQLWRWSFQNCGNLRHINIPKSVTRISTTAFCCANLDALQICSDKFVVVNGCLYTGTGSLICASSHLEEVSVAAYTKEVADYAFYMRPNLRRVILPPTVTVVEKRAFYGCTELEEIICLGRPPKFGEEAVSKCGRLQIIVL